ncbi:MAG: DUF975 family protein [Candidatus Izimaplasma sp.]|nr:DUF975 family protein [Candidatus Izimaplasma bacterium]
MDYGFLKQRAKISLERNWGVAIGAMLIAGALTNLSLVDYYDDTLGKIGMIIGLLLLPINVGYASFHYNIAIGASGDISDLFSQFNSKDYGRSLGALLLQALYIIGWSLLLFIPGIIKGYSYSMTIYILQDSDFKHLSSNEAIGKSMEMMDGHKADYFMLMLSFIGWIILSLLTMGLLFFYVAPYIQQTSAEFYLNLKGGKQKEIEPFVEETEENIWDR